MYNGGGEWKPASTTISIRSSIRSYAICRTLTVHTILHQHYTRAVISYVDYALPSSETIAV